MGTLSSQTCSMMWCRTWQAKASVDLFLEACASDRQRWQKMDSGWVNGGENEGKLRGIAMFSFVDFCNHLVLNLVTKEFVIFVI